MDIKWILWQAAVPLSSPVIVWFAVCWGRSSLQTTPSLGNHLKTWCNVIEQYGWLMYAVFVSLQSGVAINTSNSPPTWMFWLNLGVLAASLIILAIAFVSRFEDDGIVVKLKPSHEVPIQSFPAGLVAISAATVGYLAMSAGGVL